MLCSQLTEAGLSGWQNHVPPGSFQWASKPRSASRDTTHQSSDKKTNPKIYDYVTLQSLKSKTFIFSYPFKVETKQSYYLYFIDTELRSQSRATPNSVRPADRSLPSSEIHLQGWWSPHCLQFPVLEPVVTSSPQSPLHPGDAGSGKTTA